MLSQILFAEYGNDIGRGELGINSLFEFLIGHAPVLELLRQESVIFDFHALQDVRVEEAVPV